MYSQTPPVPPPKPSGSHDVSRMSTPTASSSSPHPVPPYDKHIRAQAGASATAADAARIFQQAAIPDPGNQWLPKFLQDKPKQDLAGMLSNQAVLSALTHSPQTIHPSLRASHEALQAALVENMERAAHLLELESRLGHQRSASQAQLLSTHALERQWRAKQADMDLALAPFAPANLYQRLCQGVMEQEGVCYALEESFLDSSSSSAGDDGGPASEREVSDWVKKYREARKLYYLRQEKKERWDEGRVGGWR